MAAAKTVWGIDVGQCALNAIELRPAAEGGVEIGAFEVIEHSSVLGQGDADVMMLIQESLEEFLNRHDISDARVSVSVLGQSSFTRFVTLPPVEAKKIPDIVRFEAEQQIPFDLDEVIWRYQTFQQEDSPEIDAGIFAMKQVDVAEMLSYFTRAEIDVDIVQMSPLALYNFMMFDEQAASDGATMLADVGADKTHLVVADGGKIWTRTIQIGGNNFTEALVKSFKLSFAKAEKLKRTASSSKYARQIFQVMRPIFASLVQEIQRSVGYYTSLNRDCRFVRLLGTGNGFRLPGMQKYLEQNLNMDVQQLRTFEKVTAGPENLSDHVLSLGVAYGLALQGLGDATVNTNLLPEAIAKRRLWQKKTPWFAAAAASILAACGLYVFRGYVDMSTLQSPTVRQSLSEATKIVRDLETWQKEARTISTQVETEKQQIEETLTMRAYTPIWPRINGAVARSILQAMTQPNEPDILRAFAQADAATRQTLAGQVQSDQATMELISMLPYQVAPAEGPVPLRQALLNSLAGKPRTSRDLIIFEQQLSTYQANLRPLAETDQQDGRGGPDMMGPGGPGRSPGRGSSRESRSSRDAEEAPAGRGFELVITGRTPLARERAMVRVARLKEVFQQTFQAEPYFDLLGTIVVDYQSATDTLGQSGGRGVTRRTPGPTGRDASEEDQGPTNPDPLFPDESMDGDVRFTMTMKIKITGDGMTPPQTDEEGKGE
jgi:type IV pilus assembly protein PilM